MRAPSIAVALAVTAGLALAGVPLTPAGATAPPFTTLQPGQPAHLTETIPIQIVLLGFEPEDVTEAQFDPWLSEGGRPIERFPNDRGVHQELGLEYTYDYSFVRTDPVYEDAFFGFLTAIGVPQEERSGHNITFPQVLYNRQATRELDIVDNLSIDAVEVERWLLEHPAPGVDRERDTVVFINWWGRDDFRFHDYHLPAGHLATDTDADWSLDIRHPLTAWGGTSPLDEETGFGRESRTWFHDLSAGPDHVTGGWLLDTVYDRYQADPTREYRIPPIWEYGTADGMWPHEWIGEDLALITRFVATNFFFAPSPLYPLDLHGPRLPADIELDITVYDDDHPVPLDPPVLEQELEELVGPLAVEVSDGRLNGLTRRCLEAHSARLGNCRPQHASSYPDPLANLFLWAEGEQKRWRDGSADYEAAAFVFAGPDVRPYLGFADDNWTTGTQSATYVTFGPSTITRGYSPTDTLIHEYGHHFGMSHVHDGWDPEWQFSYSAKGGYLLHLTWLGNEVSTVMSYMDLNEDFSQFDFDNRHRWQAAAFLQSANTVAAQVLTSRRAAQAGPALTQADAAFTAAQAALDAHDYPTAEAQASVGYWLVRQAADTARVTVTATDDGWRILPPGQRTGQRQPGPDPTVDPAEGAAVLEPYLPPELAALDAQR
jgi:hypothetical protein